MAKCFWRSLADKSGVDSNEAQPIISSLFIYLFKKKKRIVKEVIAENKLPGI